MLWKPAPGTVAAVGNGNALLGRGRKCRTGVSRSLHAVRAFVGGSFDMLLSDGTTGSVAYRRSALLFLKNGRGLANGLWGVTTEGPQFSGTWRAIRIGL
jgi:hypothetical protein